MLLEALDRLNGTARGVAVLDPAVSATWPAARPVGPAHPDGPRAWRRPAEISPFRAVDDPAF